MKKLINKLKKIFHIHSYKPIISQYSTFKSRNIIFECDKCGHRIKEKIFVNFSSEFPIKTTNGISYSEMDEILNRTEKGEEILNMYKKIMNYQNGFL